MIYKTAFWISIGLILYNYFGYLIILFIISLFRKKAVSKNNLQNPDSHEVTLLIPAYNEGDYIDAKVENTLQLDYPKNKLHVVWVTDGSDDGTFEKLEKMENVTVYHKPERNGKIGAVNRVMPLIKTPFVVFCDANSMLNPSCLKEILKPFSNTKTGCVAGQKRVGNTNNEKAVGGGEGLYWNYESALKNLESKVYSTVGAAGELFAIRRHLFEQIPADSIIEDFVISLSIIKKGFLTKYSPKAIAEETSSLNIGEEMKRKTRIAYGSIQTMFRYPEFLNPFKYGFFTFQYFSHKVLRWSIVPISILAVIILNVMICLKTDHDPLFEYLLAAQSLFYLFALIGMFFREKKTFLRIFFAPYYILFMNFTILKGYLRFFTSKQSVSWEKAKRA